MDINQEKHTPLKREFTNESYMNPYPNSIKYLGRDPEVGKAEAERRLKFMPKIEEKSVQVLKKIGINPVSLSPKGSTAVNMCLPTSDLDVAVVVPPLHKFTQQPELWRKYQEEIAKIEGADFKIEPRLVVEQGPTSYLANHTDNCPSQIDFSID